MDIPKELQGILSRDPEVMGGDVCFTGTRVPVVVLLDNVAAGTPMDEFYDSYPSLTPEMVRPVLDWENRKAREALGLELVA
jgi:uncharacterized protein (DUF433 family)